jgi:PAS domain S-box-containing protein
MTSTSKPTRSLDLFSGGGEVADLCARFDWEQTPLGAPADWPDTFRYAVRMIFDSHLPMTVGWGEDLIQIYNDGYLKILGDKHPDALGRPVREVYPEIWDQIGPLLRDVYANGKAVWFEDLCLPIERRGFAEEMYFTFSYSPLRDRDGTLVGLLSAAVETTSHVLAKRRAETLARLGESTNHGSIRAVLRESLACIDQAAKDFPVCLVYEVDPAGPRLELLDSTGVEQSSLPKDEPMSALIPWHQLGAAFPVVDLPEATLEGVELVDDARPGVSQAVWMPVYESDGKSPHCVAGLIIGLSDRLPRDAAYRSHLADIQRALDDKVDYVRYQQLLVAHAERRYAAAFENSMDAMMLTVPDGPILEANPAACELLGFSEDEICEMGREGVVDVDDERLPMAVAVRKATGQFRGELNFVHRDGSIIPCEISSRIYHDADDNERTIIVLRDLRERTKLESNLRQAQKLDAVGKLAGGIAHDFNNLLTVIDSAAQFLEEEVEPGTTAAEDVAIIRASSERAAALTRRLLAFSKRRPVRATHLNLTKVLNELDSIVRPLISEDVEVVGALEPDCWPVYTDRQGIEQILLNLVVNARDAMPGGGTLSIELTNEELHEARCGVLGAEIGPGRYVRIGVSDTGAGLPEGDWKRLFEPFYTTKESGTGLGLATVADIVEKCDGAIFLDSEPQQGTSFDIFLPASRPGVLESPSDAASELQDLVAQGRVLLVEDQPLVRQVTTRMLEAAGLQVTAAAGGDQAIEVVERLGAHAFDLVISDVVMPHMSGEETVRRLREIEPELKFLFITGYPGNSHLTLTSELDVDVLMKPYGREQLIEAVRELLESN